jgi:hypothetical protein
VAGLAARPLREGHRRGRERKKSRSCCSTAAAAVRRVFRRNQTAGRTTTVKMRSMRSAATAAVAVEFGDGTPSQTVVVN